MVSVWADRTCQIDQSEHVLNTLKCPCSDKAKKNHKVYSEV